MWREKILFYLTLVFISGNLLADSFIPKLPPLAASLVCAASSLLIIVHCAVAFKLRNSGTLWPFFPIFLLAGLVNAGQCSLLGEYHWLEELATSDWILGLRGDFSLRLAEVIPSWDVQENSLLEALTMGEQSHIPRELKEAYRLSGAMHQLALSGLHVAFIYGILSRVLGFIPGTIGWRAVKGWVIIVLLVFYGIFSGAAPSIFRAVVMATVYETGEMMGREKHGLNSLSVSALLISILDPSAPSTVSFQLSYSAMLGIFLVQPHLEKVLEVLTDSRWVQKVWNLTALSISCQLFTAPLCLFYFGSFPLISLLTNLVTSPVVTVIMSVAPLAILTSGIPLIGELSGTVLNYAIQILNLLVEIMSRI